MQMRHTALTLAFSDYETSQKLAYSALQALIECEILGDFIDICLPTNRPVSRVGRRFH